MGNWIRKSLGVLGLVALAAGVFASPVGAGFDDEVFPSLSVTKDVVAGANPQTVDGLFTVQVSCDRHDYEATLTFNPDGSVNSAPEGWVGSGDTWTLQSDMFRHHNVCVVGEVETSATAKLAQLPSYTCSFANVPYYGEFYDTDKIDGPDPGCAAGPQTDPMTVQFGDPRDRSCPQDEVLPEGSPEKEYNDHVLCVQSAHVTVTNTIAQIKQIAFTG